MNKTNKQMATNCGDPHMAQEALRAWLKAIQASWLRKNLQKLLSAEQEGRVVELAVSAIRDRLEFICGRA